VTNYTAASPIVAPTHRLARGPFLIIYNSAAALGVGTANWSFQVAAWYLTARQITGTLYGIDFSQRWNGSASGYTPANDTEWNGGISDNSRLWDNYIKPVALQMQSMGAVGVLMSAGTPTLTTMPLTGSTENHVSTCQMFGGAMLLYNFYNTVTYGFTLPTPAPTLPQWSPAFIGGGYDDATSHSVLLQDRTATYRSDLQALPLAAGTYPLGIQGSQNITAYNQFSAFDAAQQAYLASGAPNSLFESWGHRPYGRIGRPRFFGSAGLPTETDTLAYAVVNQALANQVSLATALQLPIHIGVASRTSAMLDYEGAALYNWLGGMGFFARKYYTFDYGSGFGTLSQALTPVASQHYSATALTTVGVGPYPAWMLIGYAINNAAYNNAFISGSWQMHPGAFGVEGTSFGWNHIARIQNGGGVGGSGTLFEPGGNAGICDFGMGIAQGLSLMEAHFYSDLQYTNSLVWAAGLFGDPLYTPILYPPTDPDVTNTTASAYEGRDNIDERTGYKVPVGQLHREWTGLLVADPEPRHPQEFLHPRQAEAPKGSPAPEGQDTFISGPVTFP
jgi:hypothetical protein